MDVITMAYDDSAGQGGGRKAILGRQARPDEAAKKELDKKMTKTMRGMANDISKDVQESLDVKYNAANKERMRREFEKAEVEKRRKMRDTKMSKQRQGRASRVERQSMQGESRCD